MWSSFGTMYKELRLLLYLLPIAGLTHQFLLLAVDTRYITSTLV